MSKDKPEDGDEQSVISRRRLVASGAAGWATVGLAGCSRILDPSMRDDDDGNGNGGGNGSGNGDGNGGADTPTGTTPSGNTTVTNETTTTTPEPTTTTSGGGGCASIRRFAAGMDVGLHVGVFDSDSGSPLGDGSVESVTVQFPDAEFDDIELNWEGDHEVYDESTWGGKLETDEEVESGTYRYEVSIDGEGVDQTIVDEITIV